MFALLFCLLAAANAEVSNRIPKRQPTDFEQFDEDDENLEPDVTIFVDQDGNVLDINDINWSKIKSFFRKVVKVLNTIIQVITVILG